MHRNDDIMVISKLFEIKQRLFEITLIIWGQAWMAEGRAGVAALVGPGPGGRTGD